MMLIKRTVTETRISTERVIRPASFERQVLLDASMPHLDTWADFEAAVETESVVEQLPLDPGWPVTAEAPFTLDMASLPAETVVRVTREDGVSIVTDDPTDPVIIEDAGEFLIEVDPPLPYLPFTLNMETTSA